MHAPDLLPNPYRSEADIVANRLGSLALSLDWAAAAKVATPWVQAVRKNPPPFWAMESLLKEYPISSAEGLDNFKRTALTPNSVRINSAQHSARVSTRANPFPSQVSRSGDRSGIRANPSARRLRRARCERATKGFLKRPRTPAGHRATKGAQMSPKASRRALARTLAPMATDPAGPARPEIPATAERSRHTTSPKVPVCAPRSSKIMPAAGAEVPRTRAGEPRDAAAAQQRPDDAARHPHPQAREELPVGAHVAVERADVGVAVHRAVFGRARQRARGPAATRSSTWGAPTAARASPRA